MKETFLHEEARELKVCGDFDVIVVGAGIAGCAAAIAAARIKGTRVCVIENTCLPGGLATIGNVIVYLPLCDGNGHQVCGGLAETQLRMSVERETADARGRGIARVPECWNPGGDIGARKEHRFVTRFNPMYFALALEDQLRKKRIKMIYNARFAGVIKEGRLIKAVVLETKSGRIALTCRAVVDASGDADVCVASGEKTASYTKNVRCNWFYAFHNNDMHLYPETDFTFFKYHNPNNVKVPVFKFEAINGIPSQIMASHDKVRERVAAIEKETGEYPFIANVPTYPTFRMTRRLAGQVTLRETDDHHWFEDTVGMTGDWRKAGPIFCIPFRSLIAVNTANLITAGRCISSAGDTWDVTRVIPTCAVTGEAAGAAAAMFAEDNQAYSFRDISVPALQKHLMRNRVIIDKTLVK